MESISDAVVRARQAQKLWQATSVLQRVGWLKKFQQELFKQQDRVIAAIVEDTGKPSLEALGFEVTTVLLTADYYRKRAARILQTRRAKANWIFKNKKIWVSRVPYGVVGILGPANLPFSLTVGDALSALVSGNAVIIKPSEWTPRSAEVGLAIAEESGLPAGLLQVLQGGAALGEQLVQEVDFIFFTGSTKVGKKVAMQAASLLKPCVLELGGKAPMIVLRDADVERAARACVWGRFAHAGQHCIAIERVYVEETIAPLFIEAVIGHTRIIPEEHCSPLTSPTASVFLQELVRDAVSKGAKLAWQGALMEEGPTILVDTNHSMRVMREESFGPLLPIMKVRSLEEAIGYANDSPTGLSAVLFTKNKEKALQTARRIEAGTVSINDCMDHFLMMDAPFGGWKESGMGVRHGAEGLLQFTRSQTIFLHRFSLPFCRKRELWWFPYRKWTERLLRVLLRLKLT